MRGHRRALLSALVVVSLAMPAVVYPVFLMKALCFALFASAFNVRAGADIYLPEDVRPRAKQGDGTMVVRISAPADALTMSGVAWFREF